ncbi:hypothetical protein FACS1894185_2980 [Betaproteobacteria bacterium]|nr:hypothetical protein FACS1894185_2980 [Betaproteobacteria bacterium]
MGGTGGKPQGLPMPRRSSNPFVTAHPFGSGGGSYNELNEAHIMNQTQTSASAPALTVAHGIPTTTSFDVANFFGKRHPDVMRAIENLIETASDEQGRKIATLFDLTLQEANGLNGMKQEFTIYRMSRDGFTLLAMGFTGKKALGFKLAYIDAFNQMASRLTAEEGTAVIRRLTCERDAAQAACIRHNPIWAAAVRYRACGLTGRETAKLLNVTENKVEHIYRDIRAAGLLLIAPAHPPVAPRRLQASAAPEVDPTAELPGMEG